MRSKTILHTVIYLILSALYAVFLCFRYDLYIRLPYLPIFWLVLLVQILYYAVGILSIYLVRRALSQQIIHIFILCAVLFFTSIFPMTGMYENLNYAANQKSRQQIVEMLCDGQLQNFQIGKDAYVDVYLSPYRFASYNRKVYVREDEDSLQVEFCVYDGIGDRRVLVYNCRGEAYLDDKFFHSFIKYDYYNIRKVDDCWYLASVKELYQFEQ